MWIVVLMPGCMIQPSDEFIGAALCHDRQRIFVRRDSRAACARDKSTACRQQPVIYDQPDKQAANSMRTGISAGGNAGLSGKPSINTP